MLMTFNPAINGWAIFSEAGITACRVMAKRLRAVCGLPESKPLWQRRTRLLRPPLICRRRGDEAHDFNPKFKIPNLK
jgi:hypothetical protein